MPVPDLDIQLPAIVSGNADAFARWLAGAEGPLRTSLRPFAAHVDTEAVLQEALLRLWQLAPRFVSDGRPNGLLRFAVRVARNLALSELRRMRAGVGDPDAFERALDEAGAARVSRGPDPMLQRVREGCREQLPERPAAVLRERLTSGGGEPDERIAERLGMRLNTFLQNFTRARRMLLECLERHGIDLRAELER